MITGYSWAGKALRVCDVDVFPTPPGPSRGMAQAAWSLGGGEEGRPLGSGTAKVNVKSSEPRFQRGGFHSLSSWSGLNPPLLCWGTVMVFSAS